MAAGDTTACFTPDSVDSELDVFLQQVRLLGGQRTHQFRFCHLKCRRLDSELIVES
jgi:hypothetical protein